jgi:hypothetical protein
LLFPSAKVWHGVSEWEPLPAVEGDKKRTGRMSFVFFTQQKAAEYLLKNDNQEAAALKQAFVQKSADTMSHSQ